MSTNNTSTEPKDDIPDDANEHCPGTKSEKAGKASSCEGCPNQRICASGVGQQVDPAIAQIKDALSNVKHKILVLSGKGGVGKSTVSSQLALTLANRKNTKTEQSQQQDEDDEEKSVQQIGILDVDLCGPSIPRMFGLEGQQLHQSNLGWGPVYYQDNLGVVSIGFMLSNLDDAVIWRGPKKNGLIKQFLRDVYWGERLDYLIIDTPPGTSDEHLTIVQYLKEAGITGAVVVTTPQAVATLDVRKELSFCKKVGIPVLGIVENMSGFVCPNCKNESKIFKPTTGGGEQLAKDFDVPFLGKLPLDPQVMQSCETGKSIVVEHPQSVVAKSLLEIVEKIEKGLENKGSS